jgi:flavin-binding protein dodecin
VRHSLERIEILRREKLSNHTYSISEIVGTSVQGVDDAVRNGITKASKTIRNIDWFEVKEIRSHLEDGEVADWQVTVKLGFRLEEH